MRSIFSAWLIEQNKNAPFLKNIIVPTFANESASFYKWISKMLPSLSTWHEKTQNSNKKMDDEDRDLLEIYTRYKDFLDSNDLFDPAWESPPFTNDGREYFIFYPEILMDYSQYKKILENSEKIHVISTKEIKKKPLISYFYENSRVELEEAAAAIQIAHEKNKIQWENIALSVPNIQTYAPYIEREFYIRQIPFIIRTGNTLSNTKAGNFFVQIKDCVSQKFSFSTVKSLLLNNALPWKNSESNKALIEFGRDNNCLCSYEYNKKSHDSWEEAFKNQNPFGKKANEETMKFYDLFKKNLTKIVNAKSFKEIMSGYFSFRENFFDMTKCSAQSDKIISTCIEKLKKLKDLEDDFQDYKTPSPYSFFASTLEDEVYVEQTNKIGVQVFSYRNAAASPFDFHVVLDASQDSLSLSALYKQLSFLNDAKRAELGVEDCDPTEDFIRLYDSNFGIESRFSVAKKTYTSYAFPHGLFETISMIPDEKKPKPRIFYNRINAEKNAILQKKSDDRYETLEIEKNTTPPYPNAISQTIFDGFSYWFSANSPASSLGIEKETLIKTVRAKLFDEKTEKWKITQSALKNFWACPRLWLFKNILNVRAQNNEALLIDRFAFGNIYHAIFHEYCTRLKNQNLSLNAQNGELDDARKTALHGAVSSALFNFKTSHLSHELISADKTAIFEKILPSIVNFSSDFDGFLVSETEKSYTFEPNEKNWRLEGRIDSLLFNQSECDYTLIDYKSSQNSIPTNDFYAKDGKAADAQMPLYKRMVEGATDKKIESAAFFNIKDGKTKFVYKKDEIDFEPTLQAFDEQCAQYVERISKCDFSIDEKSQNYARCTKNDCEDYRATCRRFFNVSGK